MAIIHKIVTITNFGNDTKTEDALNVEGANDWSLALANFKPNEATGKPTATITFDKSSSSSSSSSNSSSSSSSNSSSSSSSSSSSNSSSSSSSSSSSNSSSSSSESLGVSSSSFSDFTFMGDGWPYPPDQIELTIGSRWDTSLFSEDDVITLIRAPNEANAASYTEDGTNISDGTTNRIKLRLGRIGAEGATVTVDVGVQLDNGANFTNGITFTQNNPYDFAYAFDNSFTFTHTVNTSYFDTSVTSSISPAMEWNGDIFKTFTFIDN